mgnify:CR=1 FL=1
MRPGSKRDFTVIEFIRLHILRAAALALLLAFLVTLSAAAGAWSAMSALVFVMAIAAGLMTLLLLAHRDLSGTRQSAAAMQTRLQNALAIAAASEEGWCLFNAEGLLIDVNLHEKNLLPHVIRHFDELAALAANGNVLIEKFRQLQQTGKSFSLALHLDDSGKILEVRGVRYPAQGTPHFNILLARDAAATDVTAAAHEDQTKTDQHKVQSLLHMLDALTIPLWLRDHELNLAWCNSAFARWRDQPREKILAEHQELMPPQAGRADIKNLARQALDAGKGQERRHMVIDGQRRLIECAEFSVKDIDADYATIGIAHDVTVIEETETELQRHIAAHHEVLENLGAPIAIYGPDQRLEFYNRAYLRLWEADENFLQTKPNLGDILEDLRTRRRAPEQVDFQRYKRERKALFTSLLEPREDMLHLPDGTTLRVVTVPHPFGGLMFMHEDVTGRLALESSYNTLMAVQRETLDNLAEGIAVFGPNGKLQLFNPVFARIWSLPEEFLQAEPHINELVERIKDWAPSDQWAEFRRDMIAHALERVPRTGRMQRTGGTIIAFHTVPLPDGAILNSYVDITDSIKVEQALRETNAALATADRLKSEFVANVSYQLRTPLNTIMGFAEILANQYFGTLNERQLEYARTMMESSKRLKLLIDDVIDLAMVDAGRMVINRREVAITPLLQSVTDMMGEWARQQSLELVIDAEQNIGSFEVDEKRVKQVLFNLISNAIQYTPPEGRITLQARRTRDWINLSVIDNGIGIPQQDQDRIWNKFERTNVQSRQSGVGLGLALVKSFIELHDGRIKIVSRINQGTQITCMIPVRRHEAQERIAAE